MLALVGGIYITMLLQINQLADFSLLLFLS